MKKLVTAIVAVLYLLLTSGVTVKVHYCMGSVDSVSFSFKPTETCGRCGMHNSEADGCCKDDVHFYKIDDAQKAGQQLFCDAAGFSAALLPQPFITVPSPVLPGQLPAVFYFTDTSPPGLYKDRHVFNCSYRI